MSKKDPFIDRWIEEFHIERLIKRGGMGAVYYGTDTKLRRPVAIKVMDVGFTGDQVGIKRFERESHILATLNHPNVAQVYSSGQFDGVPFYVMEFIDGESLQDKIKNGRLSGSKCVDYLRQTADGLRAVSKHGIIHRDIKPANIMQNAQGVVKLVDFGIAKTMTEDTFQTQTGVFLGTPRYMAPEQATGRPIDMRADIYALGSTFYHAVTGQPPFEADTAIQLVLKHKNDPVRDIHFFAPNVPDRFCHIIYGMMMKDPDERFQNYDQILAALGNLHGKVTSELAAYGVVAEEGAEEPFSAGYDETSEMERASIDAGFLPPRPKAVEQSAADRRQSLIILAGFAAFIIIALVLVALRPPPTDDEPKGPDPIGKKAREMNATLRTLRDLNEFQKDMNRDKQEEFDQAENEAFE